MGAEVYCATNERDLLGDNLPPDYVTSVQQGHFYGWPWYSSAITKTRGPVAVLGPI
jgi:glucose/arabinose dehydrogenase